MNDDAVLLGRYADERSPAAFRELVQRHLDLVYGAALRRTDGDTALAVEISQHVFRTLAQTARELPRHAGVGAWLHTATRAMALNLMGAEQRRRAREAEAVALSRATVSAELTPDWEQVGPLLDDAIDELPKPDCAAIVLRFLERRTFAEIGAVLEVSEDAARARTERALDKLSAGLGRRGVTSTASALGTLLSNQLLPAAPEGLADTIAAESLNAAGPRSLSAAVASFLSGKLALAVIVAALIAYVVGMEVGGRRTSEFPAQPDVDPARPTEMVALREENRRLQTELAGLQADLARLAEMHEALLAERLASSQPAPASAPPGASVTPSASRLAAQQAMLHNLRQIAAARERFHLEQGRPPRSLEDLVGPDGYLPPLRPASGEDYSGVSMAAGQPLTVTSPDGITATFDPAGIAATRVERTPDAERVQELERRIAGPLRRAVAAFRASNGGNDPPNDAALVPYFATAQEGADFVEYLELRAAEGP